jgi:hypothetical protein
MIATVYNRYVLLPIMFCFTIPFIYASYGQAEFQAWGNMTGIRIQGELMKFESGIRVVGNQWSSVSATGREQQSPSFKRVDSQQIVNTKIGNISFTETVTDEGPGKVSVNIHFVSNTDTSIDGVFFCVSLPMQDYEQGIIRLTHEKSIAISSLKQGDDGDPMSYSADELKVQSARRQINIKWSGEETILLKPGPKPNEQLEFWIPLHTGKIMSGQSGEKTFTLTCSGQIDKKDIHVTLDATHPGRKFAGLGGNFRIQNLKTDPDIIDYCLNHLRVAWGRVEMPWRFWQPEKNSDPIALAKEGRLDDHVQRAMLMAQKLQQKGIPIILTAWAPPAWAIIGKPHFSHSATEPWGNPLNPDSLEAIYKSIADYLQYLQMQFSVSIQFFSFNESDLGIYVRQTGMEHDDLIKGLGQYLKSRGLLTKLLLGDNSDATTYSFIEPALDDANARPYIGAVSFHSWRGWETNLLEQWADASRRLDLPLIVGEGSIDAAAWAYPAIFLEQTYALQEINLYIRLMAICQPLSILQWQLTSDYSLLTGGGVFGKQGPLEPTQRFWNLKQLSYTPENLSHLPATCDQANVTCAALGDSPSSRYVLHMVNNGAERKVIVSGIPARIKSFTIVSTSKTLSMQDGKRVDVVNGKVIFTLPAVSYTTLTSLVP